MKRIDLGKITVPVDQYAAQGNAVLGIRGSGKSYSARSLAKQQDADLTAEELQRRVMERLPGPERKILSVLIDTYPKALPNDELAERAGYAVGGAFNNPRGRLRSLGLIDYPQPGFAVARPVLFLEA